MTDDKSVRYATKVMKEAPFNQITTPNLADPGGKNKTDRMSSIGDGNRIKRNRGMACAGIRQPTKVPAFSMIVTGLALLIVHGVIVIVLASIGGVP